MPRRRRRFRLPGCLGSPVQYDFLATDPQHHEYLPDGNQSPGIGSDEAEALVDLEWGHAAAPGVPLRAYIGDQNSSTIIDPLSDGILQAVSDNTCGAISFSYVFCGSDDSFYSMTLGNAFIEAQMQGQSVFAASGDWGSADWCSLAPLAWLRQPQPMSAKLPQIRWLPR